MAAQVKQVLHAINAHHTSFLQYKRTCTLLALSALPSDSQAEVGTDLCRVWLRIPGLRLKPEVVEGIARALHKHL